MLECKVISKPHSREQNTIVMYEYHVKSNKIKLRSISKGNISRLENREVESRYLNTKTLALRMP